jgi:hypothetical protein
MEADHAPLSKRPPQQPRQHVNDVRDQSIYFRDKSGTLKMRAKFKMRFGLADLDTQKKAAISGGLLSLKN